MPGRPKVDPERIKKLAAQGVSAYCIAERIGCSRAVVYSTLKIRSGGASSDTDDASTKGLAAGQQERSAASCRERDPCGNRGIHERRTG